MAKFPQMPGLAVGIMIGGEQAPEHEDTDEIQVEHDDPDVAGYQASRTLSVYIEAITGKHFALHLQVTAPLGNANMVYTKLIFEIYVDGIEAGKAFCGRPFFKNGGVTWESIVEGVTDGKGAGCTLKKFIFAKIETNSDNARMDAIKRQAQRLQKKGTIEIRVYNGDYGKKGGDTPGTSEGFLNKGSINVQEKALKGQAKSHGTSLGEARRAKRGDVFRCKKKDGDDYPLAIFKFIYRSQEALKQLLVIPRTPSPSPEPTPEPIPEPEEELIDGLTAAQHAQVQSLVRQLASENVGRAKRDRASSAKKIKQEMMESRGLGGRSGHASKRSKGKSGKAEVVVIDDDSDDEDGTPAPSTPAAGTPAPGSQGAGLFVD